MSITLGDLRQAVINYLLTKVTVSVSDPVLPGEGLEFTFRVKATNASDANGGVALTNVKYQVWVEPEPDAASILVPSSGSSIDRHGESIAAGSWVDFLTFDPSDADLSYLQVGESDSLTFTGLAGAPPKYFAIRARIQADPDMNSVFPRNFNSSEGVAFNLR